MSDPKCPECGATVEYDAETEGFDCFDCGWGSAELDEAEELDDDDDLDDEDEDEDSETTDDEDDLDDDDEEEDEVL